MFTEELRNKIDSYIEENREAVICFLEELVNLEGRHGEKEHLLRTAAFLKRNFDEIGMETVLIEVGEAHPSSLAYLTKMLPRRKSSLPVTTTPSLQRAALEKSRFISKMGKHTGRGSVT